MTPRFETAQASEIWQSYMAEVDAALKPIGDDAAEMRRDLAEHLSDSFATGDPATPEVRRLQEAIDRLGRPADYLRPLIADAWVERGTRSYSPVDLSRGLFHIIREGSRRALIGLSFALGYTLLAVFAVMALLKPVWGDNVGLFRGPGGKMHFGIASDTTGSEELLGLWMIPLALLLAACLYVLLTRALRALGGRR
jgi:hypothetical protein